MYYTNINLLQNNCILTCIFLLHGLFFCSLRKNLLTKKRFFCWVVVVVATAHAYNLQIATTASIKNQTIEENRTSLNLWIKLKDSSFLGFPYLIDPHHIWLWYRKPKKINQHSLETLIWSQMLRNLFQKYYKCYHTWCCFMLDCKGYWRSTNKDYL